MPGRNIGQSKSILSTRVGLSRHMSTSRALRAQAQWTKPFVAVGGGVIDDGVTSDEIGPGQTIKRETDFQPTRLGRARK